jgi:hypothetical protein
LALVGALVGAFGASRPAVGEAPADWEALHREVVPAGEAAWQEVPWRLDLDAARSEAEATGRPLFFWAMNGHPCGCT